MLGNRRTGPQDVNPMAAHLSTLDDAHKALYLNDVKDAYQRLCTGYHAIDDFRSKLLGFLPLGTGAGIFLLLDKLKEVCVLEPPMKDLLGAIGAFGFLVTLGLFSYELFGIRKCAALIMAGQRMEDVLHLRGQFRERPQHVFHVVNEPFAAGVVYPAVLAAWTYFALIFVWSLANPWIPILVFILGFAGTLIYDYSLRPPDTSSSCNQPERMRKEGDPMGGAAQ